MNKNPSLKPNSVEKSQLTRIEIVRIWFMLMSAIIFPTLMLDLAAAVSPQIGVCRGLNGNNLPSPREAINLYKRFGIQSLRLYEPNHDVLAALSGSGISLVLGSRNEDVPTLAANLEVANQWVNSHITPFKNNVTFKYITLGNEVIPGPLARHVPRAMLFTSNALVSIGLSNVKVTTVIHGGTLASSYPPSSGVFLGEITEVMTNIAMILDQQNAPLMANVYPYFAFASDPQHIPIAYALFTSKDPVVRDGEFLYYNLFDAMLDSYNAAIDKISWGKVPVIVAESGWPTKGGEFATVENANTYNRNLMAQVLTRGSPRKPQFTTMEAFYFEMFNENLKEPEVEKNFGFFNPNMQPVYPLW